MSEKGTVSWDWSRRQFLGRSGAALGTLAGAGSLLAFLEACANASTGSSQPSKAVKGGHLVEGRVDDIKTFNTILYNDERSQLAGLLCFDGLLLQTADGGLEPGIAASMPKVSADGQTYTFALRKDVKWSDGQPLTSKDVLFTYSLIYDPKYTVVNSPFRSQFTTYVKSVTAPDDFTVVFELKSVYAPFLSQHAQYGIMPEHVLGQVPPAQINTADFNSAPNVVNGVFKFVKWDKGQQVTFGRNPTYYRGASNLDTYVYRLVASTQAMVQQLQTGEIDFGEIDPLALATVQSASSLTTLTYPNPTFQIASFQFNPAYKGSAIFADRNVRQALAYALDRQTIINSVYLKQGKVDHSVVGDQSWAYNPNVKPKYNFDKAKAEQMLDAAGWKKGSDGIRAKNGTRMAFSILSYVSRDHRPIEAIQQMWKDIGADVSLKLDETTAINAAIVQHKDFDVWIGGFVNRPDPDMSTYFHSRNSKPGGLDVGNYVNPDIDKLLDEGVATVDQAKRKQIYAQFEDAMANDLGYLPLFLTNTIVGVSKRVGNLGLSTFSSATRPWMKDVFVSDGK